jgi:hypothetical protein
MESSIQHRGHYLRYHNVQNSRKIVTENFLSCLTKSIKFPETYLRLRIYNRIVCAQVIVINK